MKRKAAMLFPVLLLAITVTAAPVFACFICKASPDGKFNFCKDGYDRGYSDCREEVVNTFTGQTGCTDLTDPKCGTHWADGSTSDPDCYWTYDCNLTSF